jgi:hypothetical protein
LGAVATATRKKKRAQAAFKSHKKRAMTHCHYSFLLFKLS